MDIYSATKTRAECLVLAANNRPLKGSRRGSAGGEQHLRTTTVRATAIWGPGEQRHLPRVTQYTEAGLYRFWFGRADSKADFVHVDNLVHLHLLAAEGLTRERSYVAAGQAYFANDGEEAAINNHAFFEQLVVGLVRQDSWVIDLLLLQGKEKLFFLNKTSNFCAIYSFLLAGPPAAYKGDLFSALVHVLCGLAARGIVLGHWPALGLQPLLLAHKS